MYCGGMSENFSLMGVEPQAMTQATGVDFDLKTIPGEEAVPHGTMACWALK